MRARFASCSLVTLVTLAAACGSNDIPPSSTRPPRDSGPVDLGPLPDVVVVPDAVVVADAPADAQTDGPPAVDGGADVPVVTPAFRAVAPLSGTITRARRPAFRWTADPTATAYRVEFSTTRAFTAVESMLAATGTTATPTADLPQGLRWWRVVPVRGSADGAPSAAWAITLGRAPGDLNGDGFSDVVVGSPGYMMRGGTGRAYVFFGAATPDSTPDLMFTGEATNSQFGQSVSTSGDLNNDGYADLVVGAPFTTTGTLASVGKVFVYLGGPSPSAMPAATINGSSTEELFGIAVSIVGDVNGDGYADLVVGGRRNGLTNGRAFVYFGGATFDTTADLTLEMPGMNGDYFGAAVSGASDVNGDGFADITVGAPHASPMFMNSGAAYVFLGGAAPDSVADAIWRGSAMDESVGEAVAGVGDFNGDGYGDVAIGAPGTGAGGSRMGAVRVYGGQPVPMTAASILTLQGVAMGENLGAPLSTAGDVNRDGFDDLLVSTYRVMNTTGRVLLFAGSATPSSAPFSVLNGAEAEARFGESVAGNRDVNGDGASDVIVGAPNAPLRGRDGPGSAYVYLGGGSLPATPAVSFTATTTDLLGASVSSRAVRSPFGG